MDDRLVRVVALYERQGIVEVIAPDATGTARAWIDAADDELPGVGLLLDGSQWRLAFNAACDVMRHTAEASITKGGYRVTSGAGAHEATFVLANALLPRSVPAFATTRVDPVRIQRNSLEYRDPERPAEANEANEADARRAYAWAAEAVSVARAFVG